MMFAILLGAAAIAMAFLLDLVRTGCVSAFAASMPAEYRSRFQADEIALHEGIVSRRGTAPTRVEAWGGANVGTRGICFVADDTPGLLGLVTASIVVCDLDIVVAQGYCREREVGGREAVDLFWVRRFSSARPVDDATVARIGEVFAALVLGKTSDAGARQRAEALRNQADASSTTVRFSDDVREAASELFVETGDRLGLLFAIATALSSARVGILRFEATLAGSLARDRFLLTELDGHPLRASRRHQVEAAVLTAIAAWWKQGAA
jgi:UTP:GlnB (protein PII) uridylyltransferase